MRRFICPVLTTVIASVLVLSSCHKVNWKVLKDKHSWDFLISDCDVQRIYTEGPTGNINVQMKKVYHPDGRINTIGFYTHSGTSEERFWHSFSLQYGIGTRTVDITDSASGTKVLKAIFNSSGRLERFEKLQEENSNFSDLAFQYVNGRLDRINSETYTYDVIGNITQREIYSSLAGQAVQASNYTYGGVATDKQQFYMPQYNYMILIDPTMALLEYLGWVKEFTPKSILTGIQYIAPLPQDETFSNHVFDEDGKLTSYSMGDYVEGTKYIDWTCRPKH